MMKKLLLAVVMMTATMAAQAQVKESFNLAAWNYVKACPSALNISADQMRTALKMATDAVVTDYHGNTAEALIDKYVNDRLVEDMVDCMFVPAMKGVVSEQELEFLTESFLSEQGWQLQQHLAAMNNENLKEMEQMSYGVMMSIMQGNTPQDPVPAKECSEEYQRLFADFFRVARIDNMVEQMSTALTSLNSNPQVKPAVDKFLSYLRRNMGTLYLNMGYKHLTEDDLKYGTKIFGTEAYDHVMQAVKRIGQNPTGSGMALIENYVKWLSTQGVDVNM